ncbi:MAG: hypothetical protein ABS43_17160 [Bordetella sp. SCN 67-23]|nr:MAG: hypothetical protein ABS43_17160 [Bordetella sp. SCN 67-23]OJW87477.1 MAG: hypothetical protein BGO71_29280 [Burkholderiales bacterium 67-32]
MLLQVGGERIGLGFGHGGIETALAPATGDDVPDAHAVPHGDAQAFLVGHQVQCLDLQAGAQQAPELVARMGVVLAHVQRSHARETAQQQCPGVGRQDRRKTAELGRRRGAHNRASSGTSERAHLRAGRP